MVWSVTSLLVCARLPTLQMYMYIYNAGRRRMIVVKVNLRKCMFLGSLSVQFYQYADKYLKCNLIFNKHRFLGHPTF